MKKSLPFWQFTGFVFTGIAGTLLHFLYTWSNQSMIVAPFSAINESVWEHMKLLFFPTFVFALIQNCFFGKEYKNFWCVKLTGITAGLAFIPVLYYTYTGALGISVDWFNIVIFFLADAAVYLLETHLFRHKITCRIPPKAAYGMLWLFAGAFAVLTFVPPAIPLFQDPNTKLYGL